MTSKGNTKLYASGGVIWVHTPCAKSLYFRFSSYSPNQFSKRSFGSHKSADLRRRAPLRESNDFYFLFLSSRPVKNSLFIDARFSTENCVGRFFFCARFRWKNSFCNLTIIVRYCGTSCYRYNNSQTINAFLGLSYCTVSWYFLAWLGFYSIHWQS